MTGPITEHFTWAEVLKSEAALRLGILNVPASQMEIDNIRFTCEQMEIVRHGLGDAGIRVTSLYRSYEVNKAVGGSVTSAHMRGMAMDFEVVGLSNLKACQLIPGILPNFDQVIYEFGESGWVHLGVSREGGRRQILTAYKKPGKGTIYAGGLHPELCK